MADGQCEAKNPATCRVHGDPQARFLEATRVWASKASNDALAKYIADNDGKPEYAEAMKLIVAETERRSRIANGGYGGEMV